MSTFRLLLVPVLVTLTLADSVGAAAAREPTIHPAKVTVPDLK